MRFPVRIKQNMAAVLSSVRGQQQQLIDYEEAEQMSVSHISFC